MDSTTRDNCPWFVRLPYAQSAPYRIFCFHCAGGSAGQFRHWMPMRSDIEIVAVQLPGREHRIREKPAESFQELLGPLVGAFVPHTDKPYALFGHSLGSLVAFEIARALRPLSVRQPSHLVVAAHPAPQLRRWHAAVGEYPTAQLKDVLRNYGGVSEELLGDSSLMNDLLPTIRADFRLARRYLYKPAAPLGCGISALAGESDGTCPQADVRAWSVQTSQAFQYRSFVGGHFFLRQHARALLEFLASPEVTTMVRNKEATPHYL